MKKHSSTIRRNHRNDYERISPRNGIVFALPSIIEGKMVGSYDQQDARIWMRGGTIEFVTILSIIAKRVYLQTCAGKILHQIP